MRWIDGFGGSVGPWPARSLRVGHWVPYGFRGQGFGLALAMALVLLWPPAPQAQAPAQLLSVYARTGSFSVPLQQYAGRDYLGVLDLLEPLGEVSARQDGRKWKLRFNGREAEFQDGRTKAKVAGRSLELASPFYLQNGRGIVPFASLAPLLSPLLREPLEVHETTRRLFIGGVAVHFTAQLVHAPADSVVLDFSAPVNPSIATEPGKLRMTFVREPVRHPSPSTIAFEDKYIPSLSYREADGVAELTLSCTVPLLARFSADRKTITVGPVVQIVAQAKPQPAPPAPAPGTSATPPAPAPGQPAPEAIAPLPTAPPPLVVVDASHGGSEPGAALSNTLAEKDVVLSLAIRLHADLEGRGLRTMLLRNADTALSLDQRAILANTSRTRFYISIHAGTLGTGVRLYTALLPPLTSASGPFLPWNTAQAPFLSASQALSNALAAELVKVNIAVRQMPAPLPPLSNIASAAVAVEVTPPGSDVSLLNSPAYQEQVAAALVAGLARAQQGGAP